MNASESKELLRAISHDLRGSLGAASTFAQMLSDEYAAVLDERAIKWLGLMSNQYSVAKQKLLGISELAALLDYEIDYQSVSLANVLSKCLENYTVSDASAAPIMVHNNVPSDLNIISCDHLIKRLYLELISNVVAHCKCINEHGQSCKSELTINYKEHANSHQIVFVDNGTQFTKKALSNAIKPLSSFSSQELQHAGLGFSKIKQIVRILNGEVSFGIGYMTFSGLCAVIILPK